MKRYENNKLATPVQRLSIIGSSGMGALCYLPETYIGENKLLPEQDSLQKLALEVLGKKVNEEEERLHIATASTLLNEFIRQPKLDYKILLHLTGFLTQNPAEVEEMFRRMVFNVLTDKHAD